MSLLVCIILSIQLLSVFSFYHLKPIYLHKAVNTQLNNDNNNNEYSVDQLQSKEIARLTRAISKVEEEIINVKEEITNNEKEFKQLDEEFGPEITRVKKEFARMKERAIEEATSIVNNAKIDALKEVLPVADNYIRAKSVFQPLQTPNEEKIYETYDKVFESFDKVVAEFGVTKVDSLGQQFDFNFMEAIMTADSTEYAKDIVCQEYQVGYRMGDKCVRPAMVVVSLGPGPG